MERDITQAVLLARSKTHIPVRIRICLKAYSHFMVMTMATLMRALVLMLVLDI